jgi:DNA-binding NtrC family response regulator
MAKILLLGLEAPIAEQLASVLQQLGQDVATVDTGSDVQVIFVPEGDFHAIQGSRPGIPLIVVSRLPEVSKWLNALEQGAADYCGAPFEARQLRWALNSSLAPANRLAA